MEKKKLYFKFSDGADYNGVVMGLDAVKSWIEAEDLHKKTEDELKEYEYTIVPVLLTNRQYNKLPEVD